MNKDRFYWILFRIQGDLYKVKFFCYLFVPIHVILHSLNVYIHIECACFSTVVIFSRNHNSNLSFYLAEGMNVQIGKINYIYKKNFKGILQSDD